MHGTAQCLPSGSLGPNPMTKKEVNIFCEDTKERRHLPRQGSLRFGYRSIYLQRCQAEETAPRNLLGTSSVVSFVNHHCYCHCHCHCQERQARALLRQNVHKETEASERHC